MTIDRPTTLPPPWAESLLRLHPQAGGSRERFRRSARGVSRLDRARRVAACGRYRWYVRQVARLRAGAPPGAWGAARSRRDLAHGSTTGCARRPIHTRPALDRVASAVMSSALTATLFGCGAWHAWRSPDRSRRRPVDADRRDDRRRDLSVAGALVCSPIWHDPQTHGSDRGQRRPRRGLPACPRVHDDRSGRSSSAASAARSAAASPASSTTLEREHEQRVTAGDGDVLLAVRRGTTSGSRSDRAAGLELPQRLAGLRVEREEVAFVRCR